VSPINFARPLRFDDGGRSYPSRQVLKDFS
jgi:hypothetical protein